MSSFFVELWESIFIPGPTTTLLKATNVTFAALQLLLFLLLLGTYSIHFFMLSLISAGLWWSINWFAVELAASQERERAEAALAAREKASASGNDSDTEVEDQIVGSKSKTAAGGVEVTEPRGELKQRIEPQSSVSTEDEWERVSESEREKDK
ncbi:V-type ATPase assembly factor PKR1 [Paramyrothecium foliicola]|nr:V-type ATPase assembly factor PKR1 [Paramyrothecium foliicola]